ncbi:MAG TPA: hypothetical protein VMY99_02025 [Nevskiaceae bacterium]|nr:hypothetical protein [Nevskiaceae bacterium]
MIEEDNQDNTTTATIFGIPRWSLIVLGVLVAISLSFAAYRQITGNNNGSNKVSAQTMSKINDCVNDRTAMINNRARNDSTYAADQDTIKNDVAAANKACQLQYGVKEAPPKTKTQTHDAEPLEDSTDSHSH